MAPNDTKTQFALAINFDCPSEEWWAKFYDEWRSPDSGMPAELRMLEDWEHTVPMSRERLDAVRTWASKQPGWLDTTEDGLPACALVTLVVTDCHICGGSGRNGYKCGCARHNIECDEKPCRDCNGKGFYVS